MNYYPRYPAHYQTKTLHLTMEQDGAYTRLLDWYYANERPIPHQQRHAIARAMTPSERRSVDLVLSEFFESVESNWHQYRADAEIAKARPAIDAARANGAKGGRPKKNPEGTQKKPSGFPVGSSEGTQNEPGENPEQKLPIHQSPNPITPSDTGHTPDAEVLGQDVGGVGRCAPGPASVALNRVGVRVTSQNPDLIAACSEGVSIAHLLQLAELYPGKPAGYLIAAARREHADRAAGITTSTTNGAAHAARRPSLTDAAEAANAEHDERDGHGF